MIPYSWATLEPCHHRRGGGHDEGGAGGPRLPRPHRIRGRRDGSQGMFRQQQSYLRLFYL